MTANINARNRMTMPLSTGYVAITIFLFIFSATNNTATLLGIGVLSLVFLGLNIKFISNQKSIFIPELTVLLLLFQNFSIGIGAHLTGNFSERLSLLTQIPTLFIVISYAFVALRKKQENTDLIYLLFLTFCILQLFKVNASFMAKLPYLRNFVIFYMGYSIGRFYLNTKRKTDLFIAFFLKIAAIAALFGLIGVVLGKSFYTAIGTLEVYLAKKYTAYRNGMPGNFMTVFLGRWVNRLASLYYDPVNFSYFMSLSVLIAWIEKKRMLTAFLFLCEILTFGKGGLLILILSGACVIAQKVLKRLNRNFTKTLVMTAIIGAVIGLVTIIQMNYADDFGTANHFYGIVTGIKGILQNPFGYGIGSAGNLLKSGQGLISEMAVSETGLVNMAYQIGVIPTGLFVILLFQTSRSTLINFRNTRDDKYLLFTYIPFTLLVVSVFQENTFTPQCIIPYMVFQGAFSNYVYQPSPIEEQK